MPTVLRVKGYRFFFFSEEGREPPHIHVEKGKSYAMFWLEPVVLARSRRFRSHELGEIRDIVEEKRDLFEEKRNEHSSS
ncbi:MAG: DUF4160 domain-containing protein [Phycisphaerae bacterium]|nr:DUF4160 domain-containing protein [Phycisphaerae bacterium]